MHREEQRTEAISNPKKSKYVCEILGWSGFQRDVHPLGGGGRGAGKREAQVEAVFPLDLQG